ncbi:MAG: acyl-CoA synthetase (AMP-forming)/AMP-acid ligase [Solirubrobacterales bacterium]|nr:acyl-CoA synthetase (AMP-forming)/AMP-acid ligase [Solirubrobacterales bacterium]
MLTGDVVRLNAEKYPGKLAISWEAREARTWAELNANANRLAHALTALGVRKGDRVALLSKNRIECYEVFFACCKLGAIYAPINYRLVATEIEAVLANNEATVLFCAAEYSETVDAFAPESRSLVAHVVGFGAGHHFDLDYEALLAQHPETEPDDPGIDEDDVCWICYTGGTTGRSKGVMLSHRNNFIQCVQLGIADRIVHEDVYLVTGALFHVVLNIGLGYLFVGASVVIMDFEPAKCLDLIEKMRVTKTLPVATMLNLLLREQRSRPRDLSSLELCGTGGAPVNPEIVRRAAQDWGCDFVQYFGQTEAAHHFTYLSAADYRLGLAPDATEEQRRRLESGGRIQHCDRMCVVDDDDNVVGPGEVGEICAQGPNIMKGYWGQEELSAETLRGGWLHTGDVGYIDEDGYVYVVDRKKDMIVSGGENVYSSEVEAVLYLSDDVVECAVIGVPDPTWGECVHAFVVKSEDAPDDETLAERLRAFARQRLAAYKVPKKIEVIPEIPKAPTGKIQKTVLRERFWGAERRRVAAPVVGGD